MTKHLRKDGREIPTDHFENEPSHLKDEGKADVRDIADWFEMMRKRDDAGASPVLKPGRKTNGSA